MPTCNQILQTCRVRALGCHMVFDVCVDKYLQVCEAAIDDLTESSFRRNLDETFDDKDVAIATENCQSEHEKFKVSYAALLQWIV